MMAPVRQVVVPIGRVHSLLRRSAEAPEQGHEGAPDARIRIEPEFLPAIDRLVVGQDLLVLTWLHEARRDVRAVQPRSDPDQELAGVFATRSPERPNPIGLHRVRLLGIEQGGVLVVGPLEAIDGTPVIDIKPALPEAGGW